MTACRNCGDDVPAGRIQLGYTTCLSCGDEAAVKARAGWCIAPLNKSNYILVTDYNDLKGLNPKRTSN